MPIIKKAMVLSAGLGRRLKPITDKTPKPLVEVGGQPVILRTLKYLQSVGIEEVVINLHHLGEQIEQVVTNAHDSGEIDSLDIHFSYEETLLETGGGIKNVASIFGDKPFLCINADAVWMEETTPLLRKLMASFDSDRMDNLLALVPAESVSKFSDYKGDFVRNNNGSLTFLDAAAESTKDNPLVYIGIQITTTKVVEPESPNEPFSLLKCWRRKQNPVRLFGYVYEGPWADMGTPKGLAHANHLANLGAISKSWKQL